MDEQYFWGRQLQQLGIAGSPLHAKNVTVDSLARALNAVLTCHSMKEKAQLIQQQMADHDGVQTAVKLLNRLK